MRNTKQKTLIYSIISNGNSHFDAYSIYELCKREIPNISLGTVYRNLSNLLYEGKIIKIKVNGFDRYDKNVKHSHFICNCCGDIIDIYDDFVDYREYINGNMVIDYEVKFNGICVKCIEGKE